MSAQKNTLFNYFGTPTLKNSPSSNRSPGTPKANNKADSSSSTPKRALAKSARAAAQDSPKSTKCVVREHLMAASPRTRVQRKLLDSVPAPQAVYEPHFLRNVLNPQSKPSEQYLSPRKNKENPRRVLLSPVFKALQEHEEATLRRSPQIRTSPSVKEKCFSAGSKVSTREDVTISPLKCSLRPVRNLNKEFVQSPSKTSTKGEPDIKKSKEANDETVDVFDAFGQYVAAEMRRLKNDKSVRDLKHKIMKAILEVQSEQELD